MNNAIFTFVLVFCCVSLGVSSSLHEQFTIFRTTSMDLFNIPPTVCNATNSSNPCSNFSSHSQCQRQCRCQCKCSHKKPSFVYRSGKWECVMDKLMKEKEDCGFMPPSTSLQFLDQVSSIGPVKVPASQVSDCRVNHTNSKYLACDGAWKPITAISSNSQFKLKFIGATASERKHELHVNATPGTPDLRGRIVKLTITCSPEKGNPCLLFKIKGDVKCPVDPPKPNPNEVLTTETEESPSSDPTTRKLATMSGPTFIEESRPSPYDGDKKARKSKKTTANVGAIAGGVAASTILLLILCCVTVFCVRRRKQRLLKKNFYKVNRPPTPPLNNSDRGEKMPLEKLNFRYMPAQPNPIYEGIDDVKPVYESCDKVANKTQEPQYMNLSFTGGIKLGVHGLPPVKPARNSLKRESNKAKAARDVNNAGFKNEPQNNPLEPSSSPTEEASELEQEASGPGGETCVKTNEATDDSQYGDGDDNEWDSTSEGDEDDMQAAHAQATPAQEKNKPEEVVYATINEAGANNFVNEVMHAFQQLDTN